MKTVALFIVGLAAAATIGIAACSTDPCEDLQGQAEPCADEIVKKMALDLVEKDDKNQCRLYRDAWYVTYQPRCDSAGVDAGTISDGGSASADSAAADAPVTEDGGSMFDDVGPSDAGAVD